MDFSTANLVLNSFGAAVLLVLIVCQLASKDRDARLNKLFLWVLCLHTALLILDIVAILFTEQPGALAHAMLRISNFLIFFIAPLDVVILLAYVAESIPLGKSSKQKVFGIALVITAVNHIMLIISQFNGMFYTISAGNIGETGPQYMIPRIVLFLLFAEIFFVVLHYRKELGKSNTNTFVIYTVVLAVAFVINAVFYYLMLLYAAMALSLLIIFVNIHMQREKQMKEQELALAESRTAIMLSQIQPHFLYNALNAISDVCDENEEATQALKTFSDYMRGNLDSLAQRGLIPFEKELEHTRQYLILEDLRFEERLQVEYDLKAKDFVLPSLTLQPIVENAVRHGVTKRHKGGTVWIRTEETVDSYRITVEDNGVGFNPAEPMTDGRSHIGIANVQSRLAAMCGGWLTVESVPGKGTISVIEIPKKEGATLHEYYSR
ncbi:histidine kinase [Christensenellaceae bacterium OttesenSCG-928-K19]|nr:histidine kinase [Christensenellaceae bacterium OttesenSCG-928-K19]